MIKYYFLKCGLVAQWITRRSTEPKIAGSTPAEVEYRSTTDNDNNKTHRFLRYIFRRKQCTIMLFTQIAILIILIIIITAEIHINSKLNSQCGWANDESAFMTRIYRHRTNIHKCASRLEMIPCDLKYPELYRHWQNRLKSLNITILNTKIDSNNEYHPCPGIFNNTIGKYGISPQTPILAPKIKNIKNLKEKLILRPKDFIMRCPICMIGSKFSSNRNLRKNYCARRVKTLKEGWPQQVILCDEVEHHPFQEFCNTYDAIMNKIHDS
uniref:Uncharacterized protein n=1 Tax=Onchocerca volvulus TaxID=6282 RepID=A0A8R1XS07_ONCVO